MTIKGFWNIEKIVGLTALIVSLLTLIVFVYQTNLLRKQQYMAAYPHLSLMNEKSGTLQYSFGLSNHGVGPAFIESVKVSASNDMVYDDIIHYVEKTIGKQDSINYVYSNLWVGRLIPANEKINLIQLLDENMIKDWGLVTTEKTTKSTLDRANKLYQILNDDEIDIEIIYSSVYGEKWRIGNHSNVPKKIE
ncbi:hypothetical protein [Flagellimonas okinawensis]|uniref:Uncharacterized protein n=1 Tax=Flagellimonas okinawensis TaxID=3031324 RepID=A0ABT5XQS7_9FLAO|nr:hypothetical protein [[Muricauda] okinawensis]MDF0708255.1 hypothetical protein [[Muricauda] okinawensis]